MELIHVVKKDRKVTRFVSIRCTTYQPYKRKSKLLGSTHSIQFAVDDDVDSFLRGYISRDTRKKREDYQTSLSSISTIKFKRINYL